MNETNSVLLKKIETPHLTSTLTAKLGEKGALVIEGYDIGGDVEGMFGDDDYEYWIEVPPSAIKAFVRAASAALGTPARRGAASPPDPLALIKALFVPADGKGSAILESESGLMEWLKRHGIKYTFDSWW
jgi:hypothetical protein